MYVYACVRACVCFNMFKTATLRSTELPNGYFQGGHFYKAYDSALMPVSVISINCCLERRPREACIFRVHSLICVRQDCRYKRCVSYLHVVGNFVFYLYFASNSFASEINYPASSSSKYNFYSLFFTCEL